MKKLVSAALTTALTAALTTALLAGSAFSAAAAPLRNGADVDEAEGAVNTLLVAALVAIIGTATIVAIEAGESNEAPASA